jgi:hypothetical protein
MTHFMHVRVFDILLFLASSVLSLMLRALWLQLPHFFSSAVKEPIYLHAQQQFPL